MADDDGDQRGLGSDDMSNEDRDKVHQMGGEERGQQMQEDKGEKGGQVEEQGEDMWTGNLGEE